MIPVTSTWPLQILVCHISPFHQNHIIITGKNYVGGANPVDLLCKFVDDFQEKRPILLIELENVTRLVDTPWNTYRDIFLMPK